jgi:signal transduction histidine kinase
VRTGNTASSKRGRALATALILLAVAITMAVTGVLSARSRDRLDLIEARLRETGTFSGARIRLQRQAFSLMPAFVPGENVLVDDIRIQLAQARTLGSRLPDDALETIDALSRALGAPLVARGDLEAAALFLERVLDAEVASQERVLEAARDSARGERNVLFAVLLAGAGVLIAVIWAFPQRIVAPLRPLVRFWLRGVIDQRRTALRLERMALASEAAASLAHELRNPLAGVSLGLQNLERDADELAPRIRPLVEEVERATRTLNEHLDALRGPTEEPRDVDLHRMLTDLGELLGYEAAPGVSLDVDAPVGLRCRTREDRLRQSLLNLGLNALHALEATGGRVRMEGRRDGDSVILRVHDTGPGFPAQILQGGPVPLSSGGSGGSGLGLRVVRRAVSELGGELQLLNPSEGGALAEITLPCRGNDR